MAGYQTINVFGHEVQHAQSSNVKQTIALAIASVAVGAATIAGWNVLSTTTPKEQLWTTTSGVIKPAPVIGLGQTSRPHASRVPVQASAGQSWTADELQAMPDTYQHKVHSFAHKLRNKLSHEVLIVAVRKAPSRESSCHGYSRALCLMACETFCTLSLPVWVAPSSHLPPQRSMGICNCLLHSSA